MVSVEPAQCDAERKREEGRGKAAGSWRAGKRGRWREVLELELARVIPPWPPEWHCFAGSPSDCIALSVMVHKPCATARQVELPPWHCARWKSHRACDSSAALQPALNSWCW